MVVKEEDIRCCREGCPLNHHSTTRLCRSQVVSASPGNVVNAPRASPNPGRVASFVVNGSNTSRPLLFSFTAYSENLRVTWKVYVPKYYAHCNEKWLNQQHWRSRLANSVCCQLNTILNKWSTLQPENKNKTSKCIHLIKYF